MQMKRKTIKKIYVNITLKHEYFNVIIFNAKTLLSLKVKVKMLLQLD